MSSTATGGCLCGAVSFALDLPSKWCAHCHCSMCRRAHGAPYVTWVSVPEAQFRITAGADRVHTYASSPEAKRTFCRECGSSMTFQSTQWPGEVHVARACIPGAIDRLPQKNGYWNDRAEWVLMDEHDAIHRPPSAGS